MHRHVWKVIAMTEYPSAMEQMAAAGVSRIESASPAYFSHSTAVKVRCETCGTEKVYRV